MIKMAGNIEILCGALADQTAREVERSGIFTRKLLEILALPHDPPLLRLPLDLDSWHRALPANLLDQGVHILGTRDVLGESEPQTELHAQQQAGQRTQQQTPFDLQAPAIDRSVTGPSDEEPPVQRSQQSAA